MKIYNIHYPVANYTETLAATTLKKSSGIGFMAY